MRPHHYALTVHVRDTGGQSEAWEGSCKLHSERTWQALAGVGGVCCPAKLAGEACQPAGLLLYCPALGSGAAPALLSGKLRLRSCRAGPPISCHSMLAPHGKLSTQAAVVLQEHMDADCSA